MSNPEHIRWLLKGVEAWNERRKQEYFTPDLEEANIPEAFGMGGDPVGEFDDIVDLSGIDLSGAKLRRSIFINVDLSRANLSRANLSQADLKGCKLNGAIFEAANLDDADLGGASTFGMANFKGADLVRANLNGADFSGVDFRNAVLAEANLCGTVLIPAWLYGANLSRTQLWNAVLFSDNSTAVPEKALSKEKISAVKDLLDVCRDVREKYDKKDILLYFRGESCDTWELRPSVKREESLRKAEGEMLVDLMSRRPEEFDNRNSALAQWVIAQHHGLKTRLLDITQNPLVALFHACEDTDRQGRLYVFAVRRDLVKPFNSDRITIIANFAKLSLTDQQLLLTNESEYGDAESAAYFPQAMERLYHLIRQEKPHFQEKIDPGDLLRVFIVEPQRSFERIRTQSGAFLISAFHERFEPDKILEWNGGIPIYDDYALEVPHTDKEDIMKELSLLNITRETLFPGIDEAAKAVTDRVKEPADSGSHGE